jgi:hypothetical protein
MARPIGRPLHGCIEGRMPGLEVIPVLDPGQPNRARAIIERKLRRSPNGAAAGPGMRIFA